MSGAIAVNGPVVASPVTGLISIGRYRWPVAAPAVSQIVVGRGARGGAQRCELDVRHRCGCAGDSSLLQDGQNVDARSHPGQVRQSGDLLIDRVIAAAQGRRRQHVECRVATAVLQRIPATRRIESNLVAAVVS